MSHTNHHPDLDHDALAMLCGVVPPEYRERGKHQFAAPTNQADVDFPLPDETDRSPVVIPRRR